MKRLIVAGLVFLAAGSSQAADTPVAPGTTVIPSSDGRAPNDAVGVKLAPGLRATAGVVLESVYDSNFFHQPDNPQSSFGFVLNPNVLLLREAKKLKYQIGIGAEAAKYTGIDQGPDKYLDAYLNGNFSWSAATRHRISGDFYAKYGHDPFGSFRTENGFSVFDDLDKWGESAGHLRYRFGASGALINLEGEIGALRRRYTTNRTQTDILDYRELSASETLFVNVSSKTAFLAEVSHLDHGYLSEVTGFGRRDSQETHYLAGIHWVATGTTSGDVRVGKLRRDFDNPAFEKTNATDWAATVSWAPLVYSVITFQTGLQAERSYLAGVQLIENRYEAVDWKHDWSYSFRSRLAFTHLNSEFLGSSRVDNVNTAALEVNYLASQRWMWMTGTSYSRRNSNEALRSYNDTSIYAGVRYAR